MKQDALLIMIGTGGGQLIAFGFSAVLSGIYSPSDFGELATFLSLATILSVISCGKYELAVILPKHDRDGALLAVVASILTIIVTLGLAITFVCFSLFGQAQMCPYSWHSDLDVSYSCHLL